MKRISSGVERARRTTVVAYDELRIPIDHFPSAAEYVYTPKLPRRLNPRIRDSPSETAREINEPVVVLG
jgi:hypothetical protein